MGIIYANNVAGVLAASVVASDPLILLGAGQGVRFPQPGAGEYFYATIVESTTGQVEVVKCTARNIDTLTVERGRDGTTAISFTAGAVIEMRLTAIMLRESDYSLVKGQANGLATLDFNLMVPAVQIPPTIARTSALAAYVPVSSKGAVNGVASLNSSGDIPDTQIPANIARTSQLAGYVATSTRGQPNGVATLDASGNVPSSQMPALNYLPTSGGTVNGLVTVNADVVANNLNATTGTVVGSLHRSINATVILSTNQAGTVYLRPNGGGSSVGQTTIDSAGLLTCVDMRGGSDIRYKKRVRKHVAREKLADQLTLSTWLWKHSDTPGIGEIAQRVIEFAPEYVSLGEDDRYQMDKAGLALEAVIGLASRVRRLESQTCSTSKPSTTRSRSSNAAASPARKSPRSSK